MLILNENSFGPRVNCIGQFRPVFWTHFGGPGGIYLHSLMKISVVWDGGIRRIDFHHNQSVPLECQRLGRHTPSAYAHTIDFLIDGPGGEVIETVEICQFYDRTSKLELLAKEGVLAFCRVCHTLFFRAGHRLLTRAQMSTNYSNSCDFSSLNDNLDQTQLTKVPIQANTIITGFYAVQDGYGISSLGVISEARSSSKGVISPAPVE